MEISVGDNTPPTGSGDGQDYTTGVRVIVLNLPEDEGEGLGFRLTRTLWDPYPWVHDVTPNGRADVAGLKTGDCLLQADGRDLLGLPVGQVAGLIRGDGAGRGVTLLVWNCGVNPKDDPELLWSCGGGSRGEKSRRALAGVVRALACCVCASTATRALSCARSHLYCEGCWSRLQRCALCRETLPAKDSPYAKNLVAEQVFEAIATEYEIKATNRKPTETTSASTSPHRSPSPSPSVNRKGQYQLSMMNNRKKTVYVNEKHRPAHASDPNIHRSTAIQEIRTPQTVQNPTIVVENTEAGNSRSCQTCCCQRTKQDRNETQQDRSDSIDNNRTGNNSSCQNLLMQHKLVARLRQACSLADLQYPMRSCALSKSLNDLDENGKERGQQSCSVDNLKNHCASFETPVYFLSPPQLYVLACEHNNNE